MAPMLTPSLENIFSMSPPVVDLDNHLWAVASSRVSTSSGGVTFNCSLLRFDTYGNVSEALSLGRCQKGVTTPVFGPDGSVYVRLDDRLVAVAAMEGCGHAQGLDRCVRPLLHARRVLQMAPSFLNVVHPSDPFAIDRSLSLSSTPLQCGGICHGWDGLLHHLQAGHGALLRCLSGV
jgi:hypothetical protein